MATCTVCPPSETFSNALKDEAWTVVVLSPMWNSIMKRFLISRRIRTDRATTLLPVRGRRSRRWMKGESLFTPVLMRDAHWFIKKAIFRRIDGLRAVSRNGHWCYRAHGCRKNTPQMLITTACTRLVRREEWMVGFTGECDANRSCDYYFRVLNMFHKLVFHISVFI